MAQLEHIEAIEKRLWSAADTLRANSGLASNQYFLPVMGLLFLRHAQSRYLEAKAEIEKNLPTRGGKARALTKDDFSRKNALYLRPDSQFDTLVALPDGTNRVQAIIKAMKAIEDDHPYLKGVLPKDDYHSINNDTLGELLRTLNPEELKHIKGDIFGRIYEYFLTRFANESAHDRGEFFTPVSLVSVIAHILNPTRGTVLDPACGSGGMFVQSARTVLERNNDVHQLTFRGLEKNDTTIQLGKMNLAVHGLDGDIRQAITYYEDPHQLLGKADYVMANPPFNVDEIDADKIKADPRLPFGLPGVNNAGRVGNGNYVWISYFYSYLNRSGRAGFVMSSQASSAGGGEAEVRKKLIETGDVDIMIAIRPNFFYTRSVPCELWFFDKGKPKQRRDKVLMLDARNIYRQVTRKICDFNPEQENNLLAIVALYRGEQEKFLQQVAAYLGEVLDNGYTCLYVSDDEKPLADYLATIAAVQSELSELNKLGAQQEYIESLAAEQNTEYSTVAEIEKNIATFEHLLEKMLRQWDSTPDTIAALTKLAGKYTPFLEHGDVLISQIDGLYKAVMVQVNDAFAAAGDSRIGIARIGVARIGKSSVGSKLWKLSKKADAARQHVKERLAQLRYYWQQAQWLLERFPNAELCDVAGLVKLVDRAEIEENDWTLTPGRYVGVAPEQDDEDFDFEREMNEIHQELDDLNKKAVKLAAKIKKNFEEMGR